MMTRVGSVTLSVSVTLPTLLRTAMYGRRYMGMERSTFVIGPDGVIRDVFRKVKPGEHDRLVLGAL
jgi:peroxiredoxin Q/BCP